MVGASAGETPASGAIRARRTSLIPSRAIELARRRRGCAPRPGGGSRAAALAPMSEATLGEEGPRCSERARAFVDDVLIPREVDGRARGGRLRRRTSRVIRREALARAISGGLHAREHGGQGWTHVEWFVVEEQFGRSTNALSWHVPTRVQRARARARRSRSTAGCARRCAASCTTPTRSPRSTRAPTRRGSRRRRRRTRRLAPRRREVVVTSATSLRSTS